MQPELFLVWTKLAFQRCGGMQLEPLVNRLWKLGYAGSRSVRKGAIEPHFREPEDHAFQPPQAGMMIAFPARPERFVRGFRVQQPRDIVNMKRLDVAAQEMTKQMKAPVTDLVVQIKSRKTQTVDESPSTALPKYLDSGKREPFRRFIPKAIVQINRGGDLHVKEVMPPLPVGRPHHRGNVVDRHALKAGERLIAHIRQRLPRRDNLF